MPTTKKHIKIEIRYSAKRKRIVCFIPKHYKEIIARLQANPLSNTDNSKLLRYMAITPKRLSQILKGSEPTLGEASAYAEYFQIDVKELFKPVPYKTKL